MTSEALFGSRWLSDQKDIYSENAWDNVSMSKEDQEAAQEAIQRQRSRQVMDPEKYNDNPSSHWESFYEKYSTSFFKDRKWFALEFPNLFESNSLNVLEVGCGVGNSLFPLLEQTRHNLADPKSKSSRLHVQTWDITTNIPDNLQLGSMDIVMAVFVLSALHPDTWKIAVSNIYKLLKPGGMVLFRDYGRYDLTQVRFKGGRGDGTRVYFFDKQDLQGMFSDFEILQNVADQRLLVNRAKKLKMYRVWMQGKFRKPL